MTKLKPLFERIASLALVLLVWVLWIAAANASGIGGSSGVGGMPGAPVFSGTVSSTKACASGFTRVLPNYCKVDATSLQAWIDATGCTARTLSPAVPADAKLVAMTLEASALSNNAIALRSNAVLFYSSPACLAGSWYGTWLVEQREFAAVAAGTTLLRVPLTITVPLSSPGLVSTTQNNVGGNGNVDITGYYVNGYWD